MIVKRITITSDLRVMVRRATNNLRPLDFRYGEVESLTELLRTKGRPALERELLSLFFKGCWQGWNRYSRAVEYALITDRLDKYEAGRAAVKTKPTSIRCCCACAASCITGLSRVAATSNIKDAPCGVFPPDASVYRGRSAASSRAFSKPKPRWSQRLESRQFPHRRRRNE